MNSLETGTDFKEMAINPYSRFGLRTKKNATAVEMMKERHKKNAELNVSGEKKEKRYPRHQKYYWDSRSKFV